MYRRKRRSVGPACLMAALLALPTIGAEMDGQRSALREERRSLAETPAADPAKCDFGSTPATWVRSEWPEHLGRGGDQHTYSRLDGSDLSIWLNSYKDDGGVPFGSARVSVDPLCPFDNIVLPYLTGGSPMDPVTILFFGDSLDAQMLDYVCIDYIRRGGKGWFAFLRNHYNVNYCRLPNGLTLVQKYAKRDSPEEDEADLKLVRAFFSGDDSAAIHNRRGEEAEDNYFNRTWEVPLIAARQPDLIVVGGVFWPLHNYVNRHKGEELLPLLPIEQVHHFTTETIDIIEQLRKDFPTSPIIVRNSPEIQTNCDTGSHIQERRRTWGLRTYVDQLNNGMAAAAKASGASMVDMHGAAAAWQPKQLTTDGTHPRGWFQMEMLNLYLNIVKGKRAGAAAAGGAGGGR